MFWLTSDGTQAKAGVYNSNQACPQGVALSQLIEQDVVINQFNDSTGTFSKVILTAGTRISMETTSALSSSSMRIGDKVNFTVTAAVSVDGIVVIPTGAQAIGKVVHIRQPKGWGRPGEINIVLETIQTVDNQNVAISGNINKKGESRQVLCWAIFAVTMLVVLGLLFWTPFFIKGTEAEIPQGTYVQATVNNNTPINIGNSGAGSSSQSTSMNTTYGANSNIDEVIYLNDGSEIRCDIIEETSTYVKVRKSDFSVHTFQMTEIKSISNNTTQRKITMKSGNTEIGAIVSQTSSEFRLKQSDGSVLVIKTADIAKIEKISE
jgi:hypothetical protein